MNTHALFRPPTVLVAPLDWGLGHATRCVPLIRALLHCGCKVILAGEAHTAALLRQEFPGVEVLHLPGYRVRYAASKHWFSLALLTQLPRLYSVIQKEQVWLQKVVAQHQIQGIFSDNRYGLHHPNLSSIFITHQLCIQTGLGAAANRLLQKLHYRFIEKFSQCWVPDAATEGLAGALSHPHQLPGIPVRYLGPLSRFGCTAPKQEKHILVLLSGPEPQRSLLEQQLLSQVQDYSGAVVWVRGLPGGSNQLPLPKNFTVHAHLPAASLEPLIAEASFVVARSGYSTVMDLAQLEKKAIYIPTPGQTEQAYLARTLMAANRALCIDQHRFQWNAALELARSFAYRLPPPATNSLNDIVKNWVESLQPK